MGIHCPCHSGAVEGRATHATDNQHPGFIEGSDEEKHPLLGRKRSNITPYKSANVHHTSTCLERVYLIADRAAHSPSRCCWSLLLTASGYGMIRNSAVRYSGSVEVSRAFMIGVDSELANVD